MISGEIFRLRIERGREYLLAFVESLKKDWLREYERYLARELNLADALALAHPQHYEWIVLSDRVRGPRQFEPEVGEERCCAEVIWGYRCDLPGVSSDHLFPYSLGGPTVGNNKLLLCRLHNGMKANDVHLFPWEQGEPGWLATCLKAIRHLKAAPEETHQKT